MRKPKITTEEIRRAYKETGVQPTKCEWYDYQTKAACALGVKYIHMKKIVIDEDNPDYTLEFDVLPWAENKYGEKYVEGFVDGFDGKKTPPYYHKSELSKREKEQMLHGFADGHRINHYLFKLDSKRNKKLFANLSSVGGNCSG